MAAPISQLLVNNLAFMLVSTKYKIVFSIKELHIRNIVILILSANIEFTNIIKKLMKLISTLVLLIVISCMGIKAQKAILISEDSMKFGKSRMNGLTVIIPEVNYDKTLKAWTKDLQAHSKSKLVTENGEMSIFGAIIKDVTPNPINVFSKLMNLDSTLKLTVVFEVKKDQYIDRSTGETEFNNAKKYLKEFAKTQYIDLAKNQADAEDKKLHDLESNLSSLEREKSRLQKSIESAKKTIVTENENITTQKNEVDSVSSEITVQNSELSSMNEGPVKKEKTNYINGLEKQKKKAQNSIESSETRINKANAEIEKANSDIPNNEKMQEEVKGKIENQKTVYQKYTGKIKTINSY